MERSPLMALDIVIGIKGINIPINNKKKEVLLDKIIIVRYLGKKPKEFLRLHHRQKK
jgi:hypothetical protein